MFFTAFFFGGMSDFFMASPKEALDVGCTNIQSTFEFYIFYLLVYRCKFAPIGVYTISVTISWHWFILFTFILHIIYYSLCRGSSTIVWQWILLLKNIHYPPFKDQKGLSSLFHLLYFKVCIYTSSLNVCSLFLSVPSASHPSCVLVTHKLNGLPGNHILHTSLWPCY